MLHKISIFTLTETIKDRTILRRLMDIIRDAGGAAVAGAQFAFMIGVIGGLSLLILNTNILKKAEDVGGI